MAKDINLSGLWHSVRHFYHVFKEDMSTTEHDLHIYRTGNQVIAQSIPNKEEEGAYLLLHLTIDGNVLTGTYHENSSPSGAFKGRSYYGALQLVVDQDGSVLKGKWVGLDTNKHMQSGDIQIVRTKKAA